LSNQKLTPPVEVKSIVKSIFSSLKFRELSSGVSNKLAMINKKLMESEYVNLDVNVQQSAEIVKKRKF
jgi:hypothetical protein